MSQYLSKEEIKQWRSSLEKITLEEYAEKLGKILEEDKQTSDIIDIVMKNEKIDDLLKSLQTNKSHIAVVVDEFGGTYGIVTMEDIAVIQLIIHA